MATGNNGGPAGDAPFAATSGAAGMAAAAGAVPAGEVDAELFPDQDSLAAANDAWGGGQNADPVGTFTGIIRAASLGRSASSNRLQISYEIEVTTIGEHQGKKLRKYDGLETAQQSKITQQQLARLGINPKGLTMQTLPAALLTLVDVPIVFTGKQNGQYYNILFQKRADATGGGGVTSFASAAGARTGGTASLPSGKKF